jgi:hypothetical protein
VDGADGEAVFIAGQESAGAVDMPDEAVDIETPAGVGVEVFPFLDGNAKISGDAFDLERVREGLMHGAAHAATTAGHRLVGRRQRE